MKKIIGLSVTVVVAFIAGCAGTSSNSDGAASATKPTPLNTSLYQNWVHSYEEQNGAKSPNIFRPAGSREFASSRFRMEFAFDQTGQCNYKYLNPNGAHQIRNCVYTKIGNEVFLYDNGGISLAHLAFTINALTPDELKLSYGVASPKPAAPEKK